MDMDERMKVYENGKMNAIAMVYQMMGEILTTNKSPASKIKEFNRVFCGRFKEYIPLYGETKPTPYENKFCYVCTYSYRGFDVRVYDDGPGQQYYFYHNGKCHGCGAYNFDYEEYVRMVIDNELDTIYDMANTNSRYAGGWIKYSNHEHTDISFTYRLDELLHFHSDSGEFNIQSIIGECLNKLEELFQSEEFIESERQRKASGGLYFHEMLEEMENSLKDKEDKD